MTEDWATVFDETFSAPPSVVQARVWAVVFGDEYMPSLETFSYVRGASCVALWTSCGWDLAIGSRMWGVGVADRLSGCVGRRALM